VPFPAPFPLDPFSGAARTWEEGTHCLVACGSGDPRQNIWCPRVVNQAERHPGPCERAAVMDGPADRRIRAARDGGVEGERK